MFSMWIFLAVTSQTSNCLEIAFQFLQDWWTAPVSSFRSLLVSFPRLLLTILIPMERVRVDLVFFTGLHQRVFTFIRYNVSTNFSCVCPGEAPFAEIPANELLQFHQRGKNLKKPSNCSNALWVSTAYSRNAKHEALHLLSLITAKVR